MTTNDKPKDLVPETTREKIDQHFKAGLQTRESKELQDTQGFRLSIARRRYKEGFTNRAGFRAELQALRAPANEIPLEIVAADLEYSYDYTMDLITTWRTAFRSGHIDVPTFAELLRSVVVVRERAETLIARELARLKPEEGPTLAPVPKAYYETDAGKVDVDTIRRYRRKLLISRDQEIVALQEIGVPLELATAWATNDDARLAEKGEEE